MFMKWVYRLERKHGNLCIHNLMMVIVLVCMIVMNRFGEGEEQAVML